MAPGSGEKIRGKQSPAAGGTAAAGKAHQALLQSPGSAEATPRSVRSQPYSKPSGAPNGVISRQRSLSPRRHGAPKETAARRRSPSPRSRRPSDSRQPKPQGGDRRRPDSRRQRDRERRHSPRDRRLRSKSASPKRLGSNHHPAEEAVSLAGAITRLTTGAGVPDAMK